MVKYLVILSFLFLFINLQNCTVVKSKWDVAKELEYYQNHNYKGQFRIDGMYYVKESNNTYRSKMFFWNNGTIFSSPYIPEDSLVFFSQNVSFWEHQGYLNYSKWGDYMVIGDKIYVEIFDPLSYYRAMIYWKFKIINDTTLLLFEAKNSYNNNDDNNSVNTVFNFRALDQKPDSIDWATRYMPPVGKK